MRQQSRKQAEKLADKKASDMPLRMKRSGPLTDLTLLQRSVFFAEACMIGYLSPAECKSAAEKLGFSDCKYFDCQGAQACLFSNEDDTVVICRGVEPIVWADVQGELTSETTLAETVGTVHRGFKQKADQLWPDLEIALEENKRPLWFAGHSLGGALARICAIRCLLSPIKSEPEELHSFGSPRIGDEKYVNQVQLKHYRWVNKNDIVTHVPPVWRGYRHAGQTMHISRQGQLQTSQDGTNFRERIQDFMQRRIPLRPAQLYDHSITEYVDNIYAIQRRQEPDVKLPVAKAKTANRPVVTPAKTESGGQAADKPVNATTPA